MRNDQIRERPANRTPVIIITHEFYPRKSGIAIYVQEMAKSIQEKGYEVTVWAPSASKVNKRHFPYTVRTLPVSFSFGFMFPFAFVYYLIRHRKEISRSILFLPEPGFIHSMIYLQLLPLIQPAKLVVALHGSEIYSFASFLHRRLLFRRFLQNADRIAVVSRFTRNLLDSFFPNFHGKTVVTANALRTDLPRDLSEPEKDPNSKIILTVARIYPRKGQIYVLEALGKLPLKERMETVYWIVGPANRKHYLKRLVTYAKNHSINIKIFGEVNEEELSQIYRQADIFAMTSVPYKRSIEGFGLSYLEASSFGLPVVGFRFGGVNEAVKDGETGLLCDQRDTDALAKNFHKLLKNKGLRDLIGRHGISWAKQNSWPANANALLRNL
ncbi:MAG: GDP-mannose-dependent alpha-(1-6)-phosphatidylinositol monomannoside mannosyltransferase [Candidatus Moanabacter tarae]|mgnify:CR=1 FL=1|uniref:GDP-mannose-dependent alpha-(1-6)-phosphatidylinositol monomannoside mannosyltransferase n=1 Tax=Candidatus Moanibacter tarae TaxID=2200854 RepID=A0A2Z4AKG7_9BACT|nr:MAG: GDP-mannose-dependent alpha-(1-6)-phosphatidylinositol monomannoside mannosyltransferase [Candidatus Moanabacter tarae]|tara:strand:- start:100574 stop:101725 length:1152 start_codon:yes stop_codon:yes gene_type:complete